jgi:hypothetical protein
MSELQPAEFAALYARFQAPVATLDCGQKCAPYNEHGVPFCCDTGHTVPTAYLGEWEYLQENTDLWHLWSAADLQETARLRAQTPDGQLPVACKGAALCQRNFRTLACRSFPFFPYITREGAFTGLSYYWEYEDRCWVISNLQVVSPEYRGQFIALYDELFQRLPEELENFRQHSAAMRRVFSRHKRAIPLLHRNGGIYKISPRTGRLRRVTAGCLPKFGPYRVAATLPFPDEISD